MTIIYLDGCEKAGKSTVADILRDEHGYRIRHWGPIADHTVYLAALKEDIKAGDRVVWDRGWAAEAVYSFLFNRESPFSHDFWFAEWLYGRVAQTVGCRAMFLGPDIETLVSRRDSTDLPCDPGVERECFEEYGRTYGYTMVQGAYSPVTVARNLAQYAESTILWSTQSPEYLCGPPRASTLVLGEAGSTAKGYKGAWLPFTSRFTTMFGRELGLKAFSCKWGNADHVNIDDLYGVDRIIACGNVATEHAGRIAAGREIISVGHPAAVYRWAAHDQEAYSRTLTGIAQQL